MLGSSSPPSVHRDRVLPQLREEKFCQRPSEKEIAVPDS
uniref:Uncharacterized protein n=1 Tax=Vitis vinifera TaxID=29760 RepID=F6HEU0_VITVI